MYKLYAESLESQEHLSAILDQAQQIVTRSLDAEKSEGGHRSRFRNYEQFYCYSRSERQCQARAISAFRRRYGVVWSVLYLEQIRKASRSTIKSWTGPAAIDRYLEADEKGRLIQSLKSFLASRTLQSTEVFGKRHTLEDLIAKILRDIREEAQRQFECPSPMWWWGGR